MLQKTPIRFFGAIETRDIAFCRWTPQAKVLVERFEGVCTVINKLRMVLWFSRRPSYWQHAAVFKVRKLLSDRDNAGSRAAATAWAQENSIQVGALLQNLGFPLMEDIPGLPKGEILEAERRAAQSGAVMGGPGHIELIHAIVVATKARRAVETGVAYGWSSLAILAGLEKVSGGRLVSVDMPYPLMDNDEWVGIVVPTRLRAMWTLIRKPDRNGLQEALRILGNSVDFAHYDSDKSYWGRQYGYNLMWKSLVTGGVFITDDIQDNLAFRDFVAKKDVRFYVTETRGKFVGVAVKP